MSIKNLNPYLIFDGNAEQVIQLYERALGAKIEGGIMRFGDVPGTPADSPVKNRVMHAMLRIGESVLMISDAMPGTPFPAGSNVHVCLHFTDKSEMASRFDALSAGGKVDMPLQDTFWNAHYGQLTDKFGVQWMFNCDNKGVTP
ncbi:glyoxalase/bleomycin resistance/extradiol dioxygenase family protein [Sorangium sp. So ce302]|uniref:VOC family protein n=1 Tax=Sorangium sp. So ce302 TaxID=3133297 RepID=UPI003F6402A7